MRHKTKITLEVERLLHAVFLKESQEARQKPAGPTLTVAQREAIMRHERRNNRQVYWWLPSNKVTTAQMALAPLPIPGEEYEPVNPLEYE